MKVHDRKIIKISWFGFEIFEPKFLKHPRLNFLKENDLEIHEFRGIRTKFSTLKTNQKTRVIKINFISENHAFYQQVYRLLPLFAFQIFPCGIWPAWKWDRGNVWPPINGVIWLDFIIVASLCYKTWISLKNIFQEIHYEIRNTVRYGTIYPRLHFILYGVHVRKSELW